MPVTSSSPAQREQEPSVVTSAGSFSTSLPITHLLPASNTKSPRLGALMPASPSARVGLLATLSPRGSLTQVPAQTSALQDLPRLGCLKQRPQHLPQPLHFAVLIAFTTPDFLLSLPGGDGFPGAGTLFAWFFHFIPSVCNSSQHTIDIQ